MTDNLHAARVEAAAREVAEAQRTTPGVPWTVTDGVYIGGFANGAAWAVSRVTVEKIAEVIAGRIMDGWDDALEVAADIHALLTGEGEA